MRRITAAFLLIAAALIGGISHAAAQQSVALYCIDPAWVAGTGNQFKPCSSTNPLYVVATVAPSGTQDVNITQILGAAVSATNPLYVQQATNATWAVVGNVASGATDSGAPVKVGAIYASTKPTFTDGQRGNLQVGTRGSLLTSIVDADGTNSVVVASLADGSTGGQNLYVRASPSLFNGTTYDRGRTIVGALAAGTGTLAVAYAPTSVAGAANAYVSSTALAANTVIKASAGNLYSFQVGATSTLYGAPWWIMIYDATSAPADGAVTPAKCYPMATGTTSYAAAFPTPLRLGTGITIGVSTTGCFSKTASTQAFISGDAQ